MRPRLLLCLLALSACGGGNEAPPVTELTREVRTSFYPLAYFAERLVGDTVPVVCVLEADEEPSNWSPSRDELASLQAAELVVLHGAGLESWAERSSLASSRTLITTEGWEDRLLSFEEPVTHSHGPGGEHTHFGVDAHTWLDPLMAIDEVRALAHGLTERFEGLPPTLKDRREALEAELKALDRQFKSQLSGEAIKGVRLFAAQPIYHYLSSRYGWEIIDLNLSLDKAPSDDLMEKLLDPEDSGRRPICLWQREARKAAKGALSLVGVTNVVFDPAEAPPEAGDYFSVMRANIERLTEAIER